MYALTLKLIKPFPSILKFLDRPALWMVYLILGMYIFFFSIVTIKGLVKYNRVLDKTEQNRSMGNDQINAELVKSGFKTVSGEAPTLTDYFFAGL